MRGLARAMGASMAAEGGRGGGQQGAGAVGGGLRLQGCLRGLHLGHLVAALGLPADCLRRVGAAAAVLE